jgi:hypothetical protein
MRRIQVMDWVTSERVLDTANCHSQGTLAISIETIHGDGYSQASYQTYALAKHLTIR